MINQSIDQVLSQMRILAAQARGSDTQTQNVEGSNFNVMFKEALEKVNDVQLESGQLKTAFSQGDANVSLAQVMIAGQKAQIAFQGTLQVRNKLIQAYQDIMNMPI